jgi:hypothetical protein
MDELNLRGLPGAGKREFAPRKKEGAGFPKPAP